MPSSDPEKRRAQRRACYLKNRDKQKEYLRIWMREWRAENPEKYAASYQKNNKKMQDAHYHQRKQRALRQEMFDAYGYACSCCGEDTVEFLTLEHLRRDGAEHRRRVGRGVAIYLDLKRRGWPKDDYTILCMNCNFAKRNGNPCPHETQVRGLLRLA